MNHRALVAQRHGNPGSRSRSAEVVPIDPRNPGDDFLRQEIEHNRKAERWLMLKAGLALVLVASLIVVRQVFFA